MGAILFGGGTPTVRTISGLPTIQSIAQPNNPNTVGAVKPTLPTPTPAPAPAPNPVASNPTLAMAQATHVGTPSNTLVTKPLGSTLGTTGQPIVGIKTQPFDQGFATAAGKASTAIQQQNAAAAANPTKAPLPDASTQIKNEVGAGKQMMTDLFGDPFGDGKLGRINDPRAADEQALLDKEKAAMDGMTPAEMQAAREQGMAGINQQLGTNMQQFNDLAAANGVRGGGALGLQMQAMGQAQDASGQLARQLILDNMNQKNIATDRYGQQLGQQQQTELGIQNANLDQIAKEKLGQISTPLELANLIDSRNSSNVANDLAQQSVDIARQRVNNEASANGSTSSQALQDRKSELETFMADPSYPQAAKEQAAAELATINQKLGPSVADQYKPGTISDHGSTTPKQTTTTSTTNAAGTKTTTQNVPDNIKIGGTTFIKTLPAGVSPSDIKHTYVDPVTHTTYYDMSSSTKPLATSAPKIICTEANRQGLLSDDLLAQSREYGRRVMSFGEFRAYWTWARHVVKLMRKSRLLARAVAKVLPALIAAESDRINATGKAPLFGHVLLAGFHRLNKFFLRPLKIERKYPVFTITREMIEASRERQDTFEKVG